jgi:asparagine synthase (glutamine-hydrolysing)
MARELFDGGSLRQLAGEHRAGIANHGDRLWLLINLELWHRVFVDGQDAAAVTAAA